MHIYYVHIWHFQSLKLASFLRSFFVNVQLEVKRRPKIVPFFSFFFLVVFSIDQRGRGKEEEEEEEEEEESSRWRCSSIGKDQEKKKEGV